MAGQPQWAPIQAGDVKVREVRPTVPRCFFPPASEQKLLGQRPAAVQGRVSQNPPREPDARWDWCADHHIRTDRRTREHRVISELIQIQTQTLLAVISSGMTANTTICSTSHI